MNPKSRPGSVTGSVRKWDQNGKTAESCGVQHQERPVEEFALTATWITAANFQLEWTRQSYEVSLICISRGKLDSSRSRYCHCSHSNVLSYFSVFNQVSKLGYLGSSFLSIPISILYLLCLCTITDYLPSVSFVLLPAVIFFSFLLCVASMRSKGGCPLLSPAVQQPRHCVYPFWYQQLCPASTSEFYDSMDMRCYSS